jgi:hypothetical protein
MNLPPSAPFTMVFLNTCSLSPSRLSAWQKIVHDLDVSCPTTPLLYAFVESGHAEPKHGMPDWLCSHHPGPARGGGGVTLLYHKSCPVSALPQHTVVFQPQPHPGASASTAMVWHRIRPAGRSAFLLATVYLPPTNAVKQYYMDQILQSLDSVPQQLQLPVIVVGDFNLRHPDWHQPPPNGSAPGGPATSLADWISDNDYVIANRPDQKTHMVPASANRPASTSIIDLVLASEPGLVLSMSTTTGQVTALSSDHRPITISMELTNTAPPLPPPPSRPRLSWDHRANPEAWQCRLPPALSHALLPLQPRLVMLAAATVPAHTTPQALLDSVYEEFEETLAETCFAIIGTRVIHRGTKAWFGYAGVTAAYGRLRTTAKAAFDDLSDINLYTAYVQARQTWAAVSAKAKLQEFSDLCSAVALRDVQARWALFKRTAPSSHTPLSSVVHPVTGEQPVSHHVSLDNLCSAFVATAQPPPPHNAQAYAALSQRVTAWADTALPANPYLPSIPAHVSDDWRFTRGAVRWQCTHQHTDSAPGPDSVLPIFLRYAGNDCWQALATIFTFSWRFSVTPRAWREANVMALYKQAGSRAAPSSYRPISMTSIVARTFEHLIHRQLVDLLDPPAAPPQQQQHGQQHQQQLQPAPAFGDAQFGFRRGRTTYDAIHYLVSNIQHLLRVQTEDKGRPFCPVLFLDIKKAFDRVDHAILLQRLHDAGVCGKAWLWLRSFLSDRRMRTVDDSLCSNWQQIAYGVPQGCVLSPLLFLIFIEPARKVIANDPLCALVSPVFFADDGAIAPRPLLKLPNGGTKQLATVNSAYRVHLANAVKHLDDWCRESRMQFGIDKTQLVVFHSHRKTPTAADLSAYQHLHVCGFNIQLSSSYTYLGVDLCARRLSWTTHTTRALQTCRAASARVMRIALRAAEPSFAAIRSLVLGYVLPSCMYGAIFWARDMTDDIARKFQGKFIAPLRAALHLPTTTHQLGALVMLGIPSIRAIATSDELRFIRRLQQLEASEPQHATVVLARRYEAFVHGKVPRVILSPAYGLYAATHAYSTTIPDVLDPLPGGLAHRLSPAHRDALDMPFTPRPACLRLGVDYWTTSGEVQRSTNNPQHFSPHSLNRIRSWSHQAAALLTPPIIAALGRWTTLRQWEAQHERPGPAPAAPPPRHNHTTNAPLTKCQTAPGCAFFLARGGDSHAHAVRRARLLCGRAYTQQTRSRFAKADAAIAPDCTHAACAAASVAGTAPEESVEHTLLRCLRYSAARHTLSSALQSIGVPHLTLSSILCATPPPGLNCGNRSLLLSYTNTFLDAIDATRQAAIGLLPLDAG